MRIAGPIDLEACLMGGQTFSWRRVDKGFEGVVGDRLVTAYPCNGDVKLEGLPGHLIRRYLRLDDDLAAIRRRLGRDPFVRERMRRWPGLRILRQDPWECLLTFLLSQNSNIPRITRNLDALSQHFGESVDHRYTIPSPDRLARTDVGTLRSLGLGYRAPYIHQTARLVADGDIDLASLRKKNYAEAQADLLALPGVGPKVGECVLLFSLDKLCAFPVDRWVARAMKGLYPHIPSSLVGIHRFARERFGEDAGYAQQFLFHHERMTSISWVRSVQQPL